MPVSSLLNQLDLSILAESLKQTRRVVLLFNVAEFAFKSRLLRQKWAELLCSDDETDDYNTAGRDFELIVSRIDKTKSKSLGISLEGTVDVDELGVETYPHHYIRSIMLNGPVDKARDAVFKPGDELLEVDSFKLFAINYLELLGILKTLASKELVLVCARPKTAPPLTITQVAAAAANEAATTAAVKRAQSEGNLDLGKSADELLAEDERLAVCHSNGNLSGGAQGNGTADPSSAVRINGGGKPLSSAKSTPAISKNHTAKAVTVTVVEPDLSKSNKKLQVNISSISLSFIFSTSFDLSRIEDQ